MPDPFMPAPQPGDDPTMPVRPGQIGQVIGQPGQPLQPPQSPGEHAQLKQGWSDFFHNPATSAFLLQFGASMLQPNIRGFGAQLGEAMGEGGEAVGRMASQQLEQTKAQTEAAKVQAESDYYKAHAQYLPQEGQARLLEARAAWQNALTNTDKLPLEQQKIELANALGEAKLAIAQSGVDLKTQQLELQRVSKDYEDRLRQAQTDLDKQRGALPEVDKIKLDNYEKANYEFQQLNPGQSLPVPPDLQKYYPGAAGSTVAPQTTGAPATTGAKPTAAPDFSTVPPYQDTPGSRAMIDKLIRDNPAALDQLGLQWQKQGMSPAQWEQIKADARARTQVK